MINAPVSPSAVRPLEAVARPAYSLDQAWSVRIAHHPNTILLVRPSATASVSVTGTACALNCAHCGARYLEHMQPIWDLDLKAATSCLVSGGCDEHGVVPLARHAADITRLGHNYRLNLHVGLIDPDELAALDLPIDVISFDLVGDAATAREVYGLDVSLATYMAHLNALQRIAPVVPHITIGLHAGKIRGEYAAIDALVDKLDRQVLRHKDRVKDHQSETLKRQQEIQQSQ